MSALYFAFYKNLENQEVPGWLQGFLPVVTGFGLSFSFDSCFSNVEHPGFVTVPFLELFRTYWFTSGSWKPIFIIMLG